jgi:hypothetical protein
VTTEAYSGPAIVELMGHRRIAGIVSQAEQYGTAMLRVDIPGADGEPGTTQFYGGSSIYCLTPTTDEMVAAVAARNQPAPVHHWELPRPAEHEVDADIVDPDDDDHCNRCGRPINAMGECPVCDQ